MTAEEHAQHVAVEVIETYFKARQKHAPMRGPHEGYAVLLAEVDELWDEVKCWQPDSHYGKLPALNGNRAVQRFVMRKEALHVAAMALAFLLEVCGEN